MKLYYTSDYFTTTLREAASHARQAAANSFDDIEVTQVEVATDRANLLRILNGSGGYMRTVKEAVYVAKAKRKRGED